ncbi:hypothetical protein CK203_108069 [Vitis vinifera]|uniref:Uncharacterized protein n=1 Tax=Vitis vinifera TaxID=29760 RepID=A0A438DJS1_VITVI|nr:hypothetical protein CK203_108069 [Vitis vinifera]
MTSITGEVALYFDGATNQSGFGIGILLISSQGDHIPRSVRLAFSDHHRLTNNIVEYEACITGLETALDLGIRQLEIHGDSNLVIKQTQGIWRTRDEKLKTLPCLLGLVDDRFDVLRSAPTYCCLIGEIEDQIELPWFMIFISFNHAALTQNRASADRVIREVHAGMGIDIIGKISPKSSSGHEYILVAIDYFTKWVEAASYARLTAARVAKFIRSHIICRYEVPHELISDRGVHFKGEVDTLIQEYGIQHHRPEAPFRIVGLSYIFSYLYWSYPVFFGVWYGAVLPVEIKMRSLRVALEQHISEAEWAQSRYDQLSLLDEKRLRAADHVQAYQRKMTRAFRKRVKPRKFQRGDLVLKVLRGLITTLEASLDRVGAGLMSSEI